MQSCWDQQPRSRPQMLGVLEAVPGFFSKRFQRLRESSRSSPEFLLVLGRFYDSCEYEDWVTNLRDTALELEEFANFLDSVSEYTFITFATLNLVLTLRSGVKYPGVDSRIVRTYITQPTGCMRPPRHISRNPQGFWWSFEIIRQNITHRSMEGGAEHQWG